MVESRFLIAGERGRRSLAKERLTAAVVVAKWVRLAWEEKSPVVMVVRTLEPATVTYSTIVCWTKISAERPNALGSRLKYPSIGGKYAVSFTGQTTSVYAGAGIQY
jgi:hypothetical protein